MRDFYATSAHAPLLDQAEGLRQIFAGQAGGRRIVPLAANPYVGASAFVLDSLAATMSSAGRQVLVVDAAASAPVPHELARLDLCAGIELTSAGVAYLPARGLPLQFVDTRGSAARFVEALFDAVPTADVVLLHAEAAELARLLTRHPVRPLLLAGDHPDSLKHAYASCKLLHRRVGIGTFDLVLAAPEQSPRLASIAASLRSTAENFLGALVHAWTVADPAAGLNVPAAQLALAAARDDAPDAREQALRELGAEPLPSLLAAHLLHEHGPGPVLHKAGSTHALSRPPAPDHPGRPPAHR